MIREYFQRRRYRQKLFDEAMKIVDERERRKAEYEALVGADLNYKVIKDLINQAAHNIVVEVVLRDQSKLIIRRQEDFDKLEQIRRESW